MELRMILFGYEKRRFKPFVNQAEVKTVKRIFDEYLSGKSLSAIADGLTKEQVVYFKDKTVWTKNAVKRILENPHYAGDSEYPAIISAEAFEKARDIRIKKHGGTVYAVFALFRGVSAVFCSGFFDDVLSVSVAEL